MNTATGFRLGQLPSIVTRGVRNVSTAAPRTPSKGFQGPEGHGEKIWVFSHRRSEQVIYSFRDTLDGVQDLKQLPFNGKKTKPAKLRKDYWSPFATISFPAGQGSVGRNVFQKLRELKHLHEVAWDDEFRYKRPEEYTAADRKRIAEEEGKGNANYRPIRTKVERGFALNRQKKNSIADMAAVLAGQGRGNKVNLNDNGKLVRVTLNWANDQDRQYAQEWSKNVKHRLFEKPAYVSKPRVERGAKEANKVDKEAVEPVPQ